MTDLEAWRAALGEAAAAQLAEAHRAHPWLGTGPRARLMAIGASTVDWERAARSLGGPAAWDLLDRDPLLGATVHGARGADEPLMLLLEPDTEGPLAAGLARFGEGLAAIYLRPAHRPQLTLSAGRTAPAGPLGPARLLPGPRWGPHVVVLEPRATIGG